jgi:hypothetical protein
MAAAPALIAAVRTLGFIRPILFDCSVVCTSLWVN